MSQAGAGSPSLRTTELAVPVPPAVRWIVRELEQRGFDTWAVGGAVRDALAGHPVGDWDLATAAHPRDMRRIFRRIVPVGIEHGTVGVLDRRGEMYEVTTFRRDVETDGRHARVVFADRIEDDLARRDFTINAVAWHPLRREVRDPFGGVKDLADRVLRTVGTPEDRFREDYLRILRCFRFAGRFDLRVDEETWRAARAGVKRLTRLSAERIREELYKSLSLPTAAGRVLDLYRESGALWVLYPEVASRTGSEQGSGGEDGWSLVLRAVDSIPATHLMVRIGAFLHDPEGTPETGRDAAAAASAVMTRLRTSNAERDKVVHLTAQAAAMPQSHASPADLRRWLHRVGLEHLNDVLRLHAALVRARRESTAEAVALWRRLRAELRARPPLSIRDLAIGGGELRELGLRPGPRYGEILGELLERVLEDPGLNRRGRLMEMVQAEWAPGAGRQGPG